MSCGSYLTMSAMFEDMKRLKRKLPDRMELRMNSETMNQLGDACNPDYPKFDTVNSIMGIPIIILEGMLANKVGIATYNALGIMTGYEVIEAFR